MAGPIIDIIGRLMTRRGIDEVLLLIRAGSITGHGSLRLAHALHVLSVGRTIRSVSISSEANLCRLVRQALTYRIYCVIGNVLVADINRRLVVVTQVPVVLAGRQRALHQVIVRLLIVFG